MAANSMRCLAGQSGLLNGGRQLKIGVNGWLVEEVIELGWERGR